MRVELVAAQAADAQRIWEMQIEAFAELLRKVQDTETNPGAEPLSRVQERFAQPGSTYSFILVDGVRAGVLRVVDARDGSPKRVSPLFVLPAFANRGVAQRALALAEEKHGAENWSLATILEEEKNCHLYEKMGYRRCGGTRPVNDRMTLVFYQK